MLYLIYADGACAGNPGPGGWAFDLYAAPASEATRISSGSGAAADSTNNIMELEALKAALQDLTPRAPGRVELRLDSEYVLKGMFEWMPGWRRRGWTAASGKPVANRDIWEALAALHDQLVARGFSLTPKWVRGHSGEPWNERVDKAACAMRDSARRGDTSPAGYTSRRSSAAKADTGCGPRNGVGQDPGRDPRLSRAIAAVEELLGGRITDAEAMASLGAICWETGAGDPAPA